jgi:hypothetical protein
LWKDDDAAAHSEQVWKDDDAAAHSERLWMDDDAAAHSERLWKDDDAAAHSERRNGFGTLYIHTVFISSKGAVIFIERCVIGQLLPLSVHDYVMIHAKQSEA